MEAEDDLSKMAATLDMISAFVSGGNASTRGLAPPEDLGDDTAFSEDSDICLLPAESAMDVGLLLRGDCVLLPADEAIDDDLLGIGFLFGEEGTDALLLPKDCLPPGDEPMDSLLLSGDDAMGVAALLGLSFGDKDTLLPGEVDAGLLPGEEEA